MCPIEAELRGLRQDAVHIGDDLPIERELPRGFVAARRRSLSLSDAQMIEWEEGQRLS